ncbi:DUF6776 family protein [Pseudohongiella spirulinae]|uniref:Uncharacterized protein n=1 Tax=Pseudohongiella spirulinae TaxID=1249552 RepID=A0A0S2KG73_9GAMM|nr:DUF6776 family protein [Pseudohongiella spirulinae]ALO47123.1 hypothetical protein PS2015_2489 [Pseudohongiella spirulinae]
MAGNVKGRRHYRMKVVPHRPRMQALAVLMAVALLLFSIGGAYWLGYQRTANELTAARVVQADFQRRAVQAENELSEVRERLTFVERTRLLDQQAAQNARQLLSELRQQLSTTERDNALYRQVLGTTGQAQPELLVLRWEVRATDVPGYFYYELDVGMTGSNGESADILLDVDLLGQQLDQAAAIKVLESHAIALKYLRRLSGFLIVPEDFEPDKVKVRGAGRSASVPDIEFESQWVLKQE